MEKENEIQKDTNLKTGFTFKPTYIIIIVIILVVSFGGAFLVGKKLDKSQASNSTKEEIQIGPLFNSPEFTVNLADSNGRRFLMTQFSLEVNDKKVVTELEEKLPVFQDKVIVVLSSQTLNNLNSANGKDEIKQQLKDNINAILSEGEVKNIYFNNFVWQ